jgi:glycosyltransferase involved in cell wall biosynthesis
VAPWVDIVTRPLVSVIIPARNASGTLETQLRALAGQQLDAPWEVIVVDNGSTDDTAAVCHRLTPELPALRVVGCATPGTGAARNAGVAASRGEMLLFCDADDEVAPDWLVAMVAALEASEAVGGAVENDKLNPGRASYLPRHPEGLPVVAGFLPRALTANLGVRRAVFEQIGGFREEYDYGSDDTEFCWRLQLAGFRLAYAPAAVLHYRHRSTLRSVAAKAYRTGHSRGRLLRDFHADGMQRPTLAGAMFRWVKLVSALPALPFSRAARWRWTEQAAAAAGRISGSLHYRVRYL